MPGERTRANGKLYNPSAATYHCSVVIPKTFSDPLETPRLALSVVCEADHDDLVAAIVSSRSHLAPWLSFARGPLDAELMVTEHTVRARAALAEKLEWLAIVRERATGQLIGQAGLVRPDWSVGRAEVAYWLVPSAVGQGYASEIVTEIVRWFFGDLNGERLEVRTEVANSRSRAVAARNGFSFEGTLRRTYPPWPFESLPWALEGQDVGWRDECVYAIVRPD